MRVNLRYTYTACIVFDFNQVDLQHAVAQVCTNVIISAHVIG
jgi:hypothetical protein